MEENRILEEKSNFSSTEVKLAKKKTFSNVLGKIRKDSDFVKDDALVTNRTKVTSWSDYVKVSTDAPTRKVSGKGTTSGGVDTDSRSVVQRRTLEWSFPVKFYGG